MQLPLSAAVAEHLELLPEVGSTNVELAARASASRLPHFTVVATTNQTAGRGRLDRRWIAPPDTTIAASVLLAHPPATPLDRLGWLPLLAGLAMTNAVSSLVTDHAVTLKWPNDVQIDGLKVAGLLAEFVPASHAVIIGAGLNLTMSEAELPTETATSLTLNGVPPVEIVDRALSTFLGQLGRLYLEFKAADFDAEVSGLRAAVAASCSTLGKRVRVELPGGNDLYGTAESLDAMGRLVVRTRTEQVTVAAGDVTHVRYE